VKADELIATLSAKLPEKLAVALVSTFISVRSDVATKTLERAAPGKFVETVVQVLQFLAEGTYKKTFKAGEVEDFLKNAESRAIDLPNDLRVLLTRVARGMYSLRSKRGIVHRGEIESNIYDLRYLYAGAQWVLSEIIRHVLGTDMDVAGNMVEFVQMPVVEVVEDFGDRKLVLTSCPAREELLVLLLQYYPEWVPVSQVHKDMDRRPRSTVSNALKGAYQARLIEKGDRAYKLTGLGYRDARAILERLRLPSVEALPQTER